MTTYSDPYRELELYLEKAQEEIGKAYEELCQSDDAALQDSYHGTWGCYEPLLPPPPAFCTPYDTSNHARILETPKKRTPLSSVNRVCYDGTIVDLVRTLPDETESYGDITSTSSPFFSKIGANVANNKTEGYQKKWCNIYMPNTKNSYFSPSSKCKISQCNSDGLSSYFENPEIRKRDNSVLCSRTDKPRFTNGEDHSDGLNSVNPNHRKVRQRSFSESSPSKVNNSASEDHYYTFPRPPSGDVNLLAIWADNLVLEIDKSLSGDISDCLDSSVSNSSLSPPIYEMSDYDNRKDECLLGSKGVCIAVENSDFARRKREMDVFSNYGSAGMDESDLSMAQSNGGGIEQTLIPPVSSMACIYTPTFVQKRPHMCVDVTKDFMPMEDFAHDESITPPPPEFQNVVEPIYPSSSFMSHEVKISRSTSNINETSIPGEVNGREQERMCQLAADSVVLMQDDEALEYQLTDVHRLARVLPVVSMEGSECTALISTCVVNGEQWKERSSHYGKSVDEGNQQKAEGAILSPLYELVPERIPTKTNIISEVYKETNDTLSDTKDFEAFPVDSFQEQSLKSQTVPRQVSRTKIAEWMSSSLPRDSGRIAATTGIENPLSQRSSSSSAVSSSLKVSMKELADFMNKVKKSTYHPPPRADVCVEVKASEEEDEGNPRDAVTQTTPVFSRSSSFTWLGECDCSDWGSSNYRSGSDESLFLSCSNGTSEKKTPESSSPSFPAVTSEEEDNIRRCSASSSSLSLSGCSEKCSDPDVRDSEDGEKLASVTEEKLSIPELVVSQEYKGGEVESVSPSSNADFREDTSVSGVLVSGEGCEEPRSSGTLSVDSADDSSLSSEVNPTDSLKHSASFPSTLKSSSQSEEQKHPLEPHVLIVNELASKSVSAPVLRHAHNAGARTDFLGQQYPNSKTSQKAENEPATKMKGGSSSLRAHSAKELNNELQAIEACSWLRDAGFPQYAQMYEDNLFPIDISTVQKDHAFLHQDSIQSLFRRLNTLNRCARMKFIDNIPRKSMHMDESDDEEQCALSENWQFQRTSRRWSRVPSPSEVLSENISMNEHEPPPSPKPCTYPPLSPVRKYLSAEEAYCSSHDSVFVDEQHSSPDSTRRSTGRNNDERYHIIHGHRGGGCSPGSSSGSGGTLSIGSEDLLEKTLDIHHRNLRRSGSDRIKEGARALFRRMESLKGKRKKKNHEEKNTDHTHDIVMSTSINSGTDGSSSSSVTPSPQLPRHYGIRGESAQDMSDCSQGGTPQMKHRKNGWGMICKGDSEASAHSDSECPMLLVSERWKDANCNDTKLIEHYVIPQTSVTLTTNTTNREWCMNSENDQSSIKDQNSSYSFTRQNQQLHQKNWLHPNLSLNQDDEGKNKRGSYYDNMPAPLVAFNTSCSDNLGKDIEQEGLDKTGNASRTLSDFEAENPEEGEIIIINAERRDSGVGSSLTRGITNQQAPWHCFPDRSSPTPVRECFKGISITSLNAPQVLVLRKLSLLKLTTLMEKFSPSSRSGWNWGVTKFIRRIRNPDYKDKIVFGVPLLLVLQRTGQPLPVSIQAAIHYLRKTALDSTGLFRKSGVRSRIQKLRNLNESNPKHMCYDDQQAYDVADMLKQYFRELPEALMTNKLSETFISIFQYIPDELRLEAIQAAILLMPDENREVLQSLLSFLLEVCEHSGENQMTANNLAVCFAPSLFHLSTPRSASASPRRRKTVGVPDLRELNENRAAYECLSCMVINYKQLFSISEEIISQCNLSCMEDCEPATLEELSTMVGRGRSGWKTYIDSCIQVLLKEAKEKFRGWVNISQSDGVELAYKKAGDGHPLRLWKVSTEVEAPPVELLNRILWERHTWDTTFLKWRVLQRLEKQTEVFQYVSSSLAPHPPCDYCILRSWKTELPKGACVLVEVSVEHPDAHLMIDGVRAVVLASRYLIEPCGSGKSRITHISRIDTRGRSPEWYNRAYGHICTLEMTRLRDSFSHSIRAEGPETKV